MFHLLYYFLICIDALMKMPTFFCYHWFYLSAECLTCMRVPSCAYYKFKIWSIFMKNRFAIQNTEITKLLKLLFFFKSKDAIFSCHSNFTTTKVNLFEKYFNCKSVKDFCQLNCISLKCCVNLTSTMKYRCILFTFIRRRMLAYIVLYNLNHLSDLSLYFYSI